MSIGFMQLINQNVYLTLRPQNIEEISPRWWGESDQEKIIEKLVDKLKTDKVCEEDCLICIESMKDTELCECKECQILIHYKCLEKWTKSKNTCPHCRTSFVCKTT